MLSAGTLASLKANCATGGAYVVLAWLGSPSVMWALSAEDLIPILERVEDVFHRQRTIGEPGRSAQVDDLSEGDHKLIVRNDRNCAIAIGGHVDRLRSHVDLPDFGNADRKPGRNSRSGLAASAGWILPPAISGRSG